MYRIYTIEALNLLQNEERQVNFSFNEGKFTLHQFIGMAIENYRSITFAMKSQPIYIKLFDNIRRFEFMNDFLYLYNLNFNAQNFNILPEPYKFNYSDVLIITFKTTLTTQPAGILYLIGELED
jgi:hypothetical protein